MSRSASLPGPIALGLPAECKDPNLTTYTWQVVNVGLDHVVRPLSCQCRRITADQFPARTAAGAIPYVSECW